MKKIVFLFLVLSLLTGASARAEKINVVATINVISDIVNQIGMSNVKTYTLVKAMETPHTYSLTPEDMNHVVHADLIFAICSGLEPFLESLGRDDIICLSSIEAIKRIGMNPHIWLDPENAKLIARYVKLKLSEIDRRSEKYYEKNLNAYMKRLDQMENEIKLIARKYKGRHVILTTGAFVYLTDYMGLNVSGIIVREAGEKPSLKEIIQLNDVIKRDNVSVIIDLKQVDLGIVKQLADENGMGVCKATPLLIDDEDYITMMLNNAECIKNAFSNKKESKEYSFLIPVSIFIVVVAVVIFIILYNRERG